MRSVLVTGASTGIGRASALRLDAAGWRVFAGVRREEDAESLREAASPALTPVRLDVTDADQIAAAAALVAERAGGLQGLVNNAGTVERALSSSRPRTRYLVGIDAKVQARVRPLVPTPLWDRLVAKAMGLVGAAAHSASSVARVRSTPRSLRP